MLCCKQDIDLYSSRGSTAMSSEAILRGQRRGLGMRWVSVWVD